MVISEAFARYCLEEIELKGGAEKTAKNYRSALASFLLCCGDLPVQLLCIDNLNRWRMFREQRGNKLSTISHDLSRFKQVLKYLRRRGITVMDYDLVDLPRVTYEPRTYLVADEVQQLIDVIPSARDKAIYACLFDTGCRISELLNINRVDVQHGSAQIVGKGSIIGTVYFSEWSLGYLNAYLKSRHDQLTPLFISGQCKRITISRVQQLLHIYTDLAGIEKNVTPHTFRHSFATDLKINGADIYDIKEQLRHKKISSTEIYVHINDQRKQEIYDKFHTRMEP